MPAEPDQDALPAERLTGLPEVDGEADTGDSLPSLLVELTKPRLAMLSTLTGVAGYLAAPGAFSWPGLAAVSAAIFLAAGGALTLNQWMERATDGRMTRTAGRPLPSGRLAPAAALGFGLLMTASGLLVALLTLPAIATGLTALTVASYLLLYTPLKKRTHWCTHAGAFPGALPPLIGWSAATGHPGGLGLWLFAIVLLWQMPHFFAIAWLCREDYARGGLRILSVTRPDGHRLVRENFLYLALLYPVTLGPVLTGAAGWIYGGTALFLNTVFLVEGLCFARTVRTRDRVRNRLFLFSLLYLPVLFVVLLFDLRS